MWWQKQRRRKGSESSRLAFEVRMITGRILAFTTWLTSRMVNSQSSSTSRRLSCTSDSVLSISSSSRTTRSSARKARPIGPQIT